MRVLALLSMLGSGVAGDVKIQAAVEVDGWTRGDRAPKDHSLQVIISLQNQNMEKLNDEILATSSPNSPRYGQHLTSQEIADLTGPEPNSKKTMWTWLWSSGVNAQMSRWGDRFTILASVSELEALFKAQIHAYQREVQCVFQAGDLFAPKEVAPGIAAVFGLHGTPLLRREKKLLREKVTTEVADVTPELLRNTYNMNSSFNISRSSKNTRAVALFQGEYVKQADLAAFFKQFVPNAQPDDQKFTCFPGRCETVDKEKAGGEAMLDVSYIMGTVPGIKTEVWAFENRQWCTDLKNWTAHIIDHENPPLVFSVSYGVQNSVKVDIFNGCNEQIARSIEEDFAKITARGVTIIFSSGDDGSGGAFLRKKKLYPSWPASAPHVTSVGSTQFLSGSSGEEIAVVPYGSGGGFDWRFKRQTWQEEAVTAYLADKDAHLPDASNFPSDGRATPEVSGVGRNYKTIVDGGMEYLGGTSASTPFFASLVSLLNEARTQKGKSPLGFLNPLIYELGKTGKGFTDIVKGNNKHNHNSLPLREGYSCTKGWDPVTGWGTPKFQEILEYVESLPSGKRSTEEIVV